jgi:hypothetical protein
MQASDFNQEGQKMGHNIHDIFLVSFVNQDKDFIFFYWKITRSSGLCSCCQLGLLTEVFGGMQI